MVPCVRCKGRATASVVRVHCVDRWSVNLRLCDACYEPLRDTYMVEERLPLEVKRLFVAWYAIPG